MFKRNAKDEPWPIYFVNISRLCSMIYAPSFLCLKRMIRILVLLSRIVSRTKLNRFGIINNKKIGLASNVFCDVKKLRNHTCVAFDIKQTLIEQSN